MKTIMFHRFNDENNISTGQGSFSARNLDDFIKREGEEKFFKIDDINKLKNGESTDIKKVLLTFDDGLNSQYETAKPVLDKYGIKSFWFIYTKIFEKNFDLNELLNFFISRYYSDFDKFFQNFIFFCNGVEHHWQSNDYKIYSKDLYSKFNFYSEFDMRFRFLRNRVLSYEQFKEIVIKLFKSEDFKYQEVSKKLWLNESKVKNLINEGHEVGLHSHNHPFTISNYSKSKQFDEYKTNHDILKSITDIEPTSVAYPLGSFNKDTLEIMHELKIQIGFRSSWFTIDKILDSMSDNLLLPRFDSATIK